ncbi:amine acid ABC transporter, permease protein, 3-TM region, His/Glu/Gln/Arg/opine family [Sphaerochaeta pleomorpha str. Grapes]|uniref:Amine acid ABC transporter, permease protein, 3-TM region, His/Glu/Gln/Arg/opine family n=1 Tax=Sphaerochaeta pleomorpha (strain ATCC BAA-1885 / DSM 22778 / Grapes) TaxID=158190 RepID=G8QYA4_SPHPG|nr:ABC transporter permease subunit [Sphaerochaeta pleomorpha]AEV29669.1 amine acid ABC transporter, permease protein, 3-TM region, His/Glu/Gln/Arg/opine family [Sphaerochaeta pleomorpha str. Grapes]
MKRKKTGIPIWQDTHKRQFIWQFLFALIALYVVSAGYGNIIDSLARIGMVPSFKFLKMPSNFNLGDSFISVTNTSSNSIMLLAGFLNTISISFLAIVFSIFLGLAIALCRLSSNWLLKKMATIYIEIIRNIPLLLLLLLWYRAFFLRMPGIREGVIWGSSLLADGSQQVLLSLSNRGFSVAWLVPTAYFKTYRWFVLAGLVLAVLLCSFLVWKQQRTGKKQAILFYPILLFLGFAFISYHLLPQKAFYLDIPVMKRFNLEGGLHITAEWFSLFSGLVLYTSAFVAEIFRSGLQGVSKGQVEAARALGLSHYQTLRLVVIPQAKVVVIPPLTSQCLGVAKNTSLGVAIGFPDLFSITGTMINQTGRAMEMILIAMAIYLGLSLLTSYIMNIYNKHILIKER